MPAAPTVSEALPPPVEWRPEAVPEVWDHGPRALRSHDLARWLEGPRSRIRPRERG